MPRSRSAIAVAGVAGVGVLLLLAWWVGFRAAHSITDDAFVQSDMVELAPRVAGQIVEMRVADNESVVRGQVLARIDPQPYQRKLAQTEAALRVAEAEHAVAVATLQRMPQPMPQQLDAAAQRVEAARAAVAEAQMQLDYTALVAPFDGVVARRFKFQGDYGGAGVPVFSLYDTNNLFVTAHLEETKIASIAAGHAVEVTVDAIAKPFDGRVLWVGKATGAQFALIPRDLSTGEFTKVIQRVPVRIAIPKDERWAQLRPGLSASVAISHSGPAGGTQPASAPAKAN